MRHPPHLRLVVLLLGAALVVLNAACPQESITEENRELWTDGSKAANVNEIVRKSRLGGELVQRLQVLTSAPKDAVLGLTSLDGQGFATGASYRREGPKGKRYVELRRTDGKQLVFSRGDDEVLLLPDLPVVVLDVRHRLHARPSQDVVLLDLENAVAMPARINEQGQLVVAGIARAVTDTIGGLVDVKAGEGESARRVVEPGLSAPQPSDPVLPAHSSRAPFLEARTAMVVTWCRAQALGAGAVEAARALALAAKPKLVAERAGGPPSAFMAVQFGGGDEHGAALVVACLRALEMPARVVSGQAGDDPSPRTWAQVHDGAAWVDVDPLDIDVQGRSTLPHHARVEGFRGPLTTGLVSGASGVSGLPSAPATP